MRTKEREKRSPKPCRYEKSFLAFMLLLVFVGGCQDKNPNFNNEVAEYISIEESKKISLTEIYLCAERDYVWASCLADKIVESKDNLDEISTTLSYLEELKTAVEKIQLPGAMDVIYRSDTPFLGKGDNYIREPLILTPKDELELARRLSNHFDIGSIRHAAWGYKDGFLDSLNLLLRNCQLEATGVDRRTLVMGNPCF